MLAEPKMSNYLLTELVRLLDERAFVFDSDTMAVNESLRQTQEDVVQKIHRRASILDRKRTLATRLNQHQHRLQTLLWLGSGLWFFLGFSATYALMQQSSLNFFFLLISALGINTLMLIVWLIGLTFAPKSNDHLLPFITWRNTDTVGQAIVQLYAQNLTTPLARWQRGAASHRLALSGILGMFCATLLLFIARQYSFNWQSTLLSNEVFTQIIRTIAWLPEKIGFTVPDTQSILDTRNQNNTTNAHQWASFLLGSLLCYGILPRLLAWLFCRYKMRQNTLQIDLNLPYYQNLIQLWQRKIVDSSDDYQADKIQAAPPISLNQTGTHWAVLLDSPHHDPAWCERQLGQEWLNKGVIATRDEINDFIVQLAKQPTQILVGVRAHNVPDRGTIRVLQRIAQTAQNGMIVQLLLPKNLSGSPKEVLNQWYELFHQHQWVWLDAR